MPIKIYKNFLKVFFLITTIFFTTFSQSLKITNFKIESYLPNHTYNREYPPNFNITLKANSNIKGKLSIKIREINDQNFSQIYEEKIKITPGSHNLIFNYKDFKQFSLNPEFYEIFAQINISDNKYYSDTLTFVYNIDSLRYISTNPNDLETFWSKTFLDMDTIAPNYRVDTLFEKCTEKVNVFKLTYTSFDLVTIKAWYCIPREVEKPPVVIVLPSYGNGPIQIPYNFSENGFVSLALQIHGKDVELDTYPSGDDPSAGLNLDNPEKYYIRYAIAHIKRAIDFLYSQSEIDTSHIAVYGTSQGGGLALLISGLDSRIKATAAIIPTLISFPQALKSGGYWRIRRAIKNKYFSEETALKTLTYFDANNIRKNITNPVLLSAHFKDRISTPNTIISFYNQLKSKNKQLIIQSEHGHQFLEHHWDITLEWLKMIFNN